jgi:hypothetical protein
MQPDFSYNADPQRFDPLAPPPPRKKPSTGCVLVVLALVGVVGLLVCCGGGGLLVKFGLDVMTAGVEKQLRDNPRLREHVGEVRSLKMDFAKSAAAAGENDFVYRVEGTKGSGELTVHLEDAASGEQKVASAKLRLTTGQEIDLLAQ